MLPPTLIQSRSGVSACSAGVHAGALTITTAFFAACPFAPSGVASAAGASAKRALVEQSRLIQRPKRMASLLRLE